MSALLELRKKIYSIGSYVAASPYQDSKPDLFVVIGYADDGRLLRVRNAEWPDYEKLISIKHDKIKLYGNKNAVDKDQKNRKFF